MSLLLSLFTCAVSFAYIPEYSMIATHAADQHGKGAYFIEQEVTFKKDGETYVVKESWLVASEYGMRVTLEGRGPLKGLVQGTMIYDGTQRHFVEAGSANVRSVRLGDDWLEPLFHFRNAKYFRSRLVTLKVAPAESVRERAPLPATGDIKYEAPGFIRLSRVGGSIAWAIGVPPSVGVAPTLWLEQDQFVLRKYRGSDQAILRAGDYVKFEDGLWFPRQRNYSFGGYSIDVQTLRVKALGKLKPDDKSFKTSNLNGAKDGLKLPDAEALKEFYSRFR